MSGPPSPDPSGLEPANPEPAGPESASLQRAPTEAERQQAIDRIQQALADDHIPFDDLDDRFAAVYDARSVAALDQSIADLPVPVAPPPPPAARHPAPSSQFSLIGDARIGGWVAVGDRLDVSSGVGDVFVDLSSASFEAETVTISAWSLIGDVKVIVPDGARVQVEGFQLIGDKQQGLVPPVDGGTLIRIRAYCLIGDLRVHSLSLVPEGALRRLWAKLRKG